MTSDVLLFCKEYWILLIYCCLPYYQSVTSHSTHGLLSPFIHQAIHQTGITQPSKLLLAQDKSVGVLTLKKAQLFFLPESPPGVRLHQVSFPDLLSPLGTRIHEWLQEVCHTLSFSVRCKLLPLCHMPSHVPGLLAYDSTLDPALLACWIINTQGRKERKGMGKFGKLCF